MSYVFFYLHLPHIGHTREGPDTRNGNHSDFVPNWIIRLKKIKIFLRHDIIFLFFFINFHFETVL